MDILNDELNLGLIHLDVLVIILINFYLQIQKQGKDFCITGVIVGTKEKDPKILKFNEEDKSKINQKVDKVDIEDTSYPVKDLFGFETVDAILDKIIYITKFTILNWEH